MANEASKTRRFRPADFADTYLSGRVIDIGCGPDLIVSHAEPFDLVHGDAQEVAKVRSNGAYDAVCSSHCLEHMRDVPRALSQWWALLKEGGHMIIVVPEEDLYEQRYWPSLFNEDHKATFTLGRRTTWSPVSYDILELCNQLQGLELVSAEVQDANYDRSMLAKSNSAFSRFLFRLHLRIQSAFRFFRLRDGGMLGRALTGFLRRCGMPVDQTAGAALAQIQIIARKRVGH